jgi:TRAP-type transport system periplasmic protein
MKIVRFGAIAAAAFALAASAQAQTVLKIGYATAKDSHYGVGSTAFCDDIEKGTAGRYKCQHFPASALGGERSWARRTSSTPPPGHWATSCPR